jgi:hypothetical protein
VPKWAGVACSGGVWTGAAPAVILLDLYDGGSGKFNNVSGQIGTLAPLADLTGLDLTFTNAAGDVAGLARLAQLTALVRHSTKVTGQAPALAPLTRLPTLDLIGTSVAGDV